MVKELNINLQRNWEIEFVTFGIIRNLGKFIHRKLDFYKNDYKLKWWLIKSFTNKFVIKGNYGNECELKGLGVIKNQLGNEIEFN